MSYLFQVEDVRRSYAGRQVLKSAGLWIRPGAVTALMGRNGSGKTTLLEVAVGWRSGERGAVLIGERRMATPTLAQLARAGVFYLRQGSWLSTGHTVGAHFDAVDTLIDDAATGSAIARLELEEFLDRYPRELSGGERRRVELALALARRPSCLIADEPFHGLAPRDADLIATLFTELAHDGCGVLASGHEVPRLMAIADFVIWVVAGVTHDLGSKEQALAHDAFGRQYLGSWSKSGERGAR